MSERIMTLPVEVEPLSQAAQVLEFELRPKILPVSSAEPKQPSGRFNFLDFHDLGLRVRAQEMGLENGRVFADRRLYAFLAEAKEAGVAEDALSKTRPDQAKKILECTWFYLCTDASFTEISGEYGYRQRVSSRGLVLRFIRNIYLKSSDELRAKYPFEDFHFAKATSQRHLDHASEVLRGKRAAVRLLVASGISEYKQIAAEAGISEAMAIKLLVSFRKSRLLPASKREMGVRARRKIEGASTPEEYRLIHRSAPGNMVNTSSYISLKAMLRRNGFRVSNSDIQPVARELGRLNVPLKQVYRQIGSGERRSYGNYLLPQQEQDAINAIRGSLYLRELLGCG